jgi:hypothetical protein
MGGFPPFRLSVLHSGCRWCDLDRPGSPSGVNHWRRLRYCQGYAHRLGHQRHFPESVAVAAPVVDHAAIGPIAAPCPRGNEGPVVAARTQREDQHAERLGAAHLTRPERSSKPIQALAPGAHDKLADATLGIQPTIWVLRGESLVVMLVAGEDDVRSGLGDALSGRTHRFLTAMLLSRAEEGVVPIGQGARCRVRSQVSA